MNYDLVVKIVRTASHGLHWDLSFRYVAAIHAVLLKPTQLQKPQFQAERRPVAACCSARLVHSRELGVLKGRKARCSHHGV